MNCIFRIVDVRTMEIIKVGMSHMLSDRTLKTALYGVNGISISDCVLDFRSYESSTECMRDKKRYIKKYVPKYNPPESAEWDFLPAITDEEEMKWTSIISHKDAFHSKDNVLLVLSHLEAAGLYQEEYLNYRNPKILYKIRNAFCLLVNQKHQTAATSKQEISEYERKQLLQKWNTFFTESGISFRKYPAEFHGITKLYRCFRPDFCSSRNEVKLNGIKSEIPLYFVICPERNQWNNRQDFTEWFADNKQIADEYALPVVMLGRLPDESGICETDLYLNHCLYRKCRMFISNQRVCVIKQKTESEL